jgi:hypothetical protein
VGGSLQKYVIVKPHVPIVWPVQHGVNLIQKEVSSLEEARFLFDFECQNNPLSLFRGEPSILNNFRVLSTYTLNVIKPANISSWSTSHCGKKVKRPLVFKLMQ